MKSAFFSVITKHNFIREIFFYKFSIISNTFFRKKNYSIIQFLMNNAIIIHLLEFFSRERHLLEYVIIYI